MTRKRQMLLDIISASSTPLNAQQVVDQTQGIVDQATVYRGLKYLEENNMITSFVFDCDDRGVERYYNVSGKSSHHHYMHCEGCHQFFPFSHCIGTEVLGEIQKESGFQVTEHYLTLKGYCKECQLHG